MYSSAMPTLAEPSANSAVVPITNSDRLLCIRRSVLPINASIAPLLRTIAKTPPTMNTKKMMSAASFIPLGIAVKNAVAGKGG